MFALALAESIRVESMSERAPSGGTRMWSSPRSGVLSAIYQYVLRTLSISGMADKLCHIGSKVFGVCVGSILHPDNQCHSSDPSYDQTEEESYGATTDSGHPEATQFGSNLFSCLFTSVSAARKFNLFNWPDLTLTRVRTNDAGPTDIDVENPTIVRSSFHESSSSKSVALNHQQDLEVSSNQISTKNSMSLAEPGRSEDLSTSWVGWVRKSN